MTRRLYTGRRKAVGEMSPRELHRLIIFALRDFEAAKSAAMGRVMAEAMAAMRAHSEALAAMITPPDEPPLKH